VPPGRCAYSQKWSTILLSYVTGGGLHPFFLSAKEGVRDEKNRFGDVFIQSATDTHIDDATSTKQNLKSAPGLVVLASDSESKYYLHNAVGLDDGVPPSSCTILGTSANEAISGTSADDVICAGGGNDTLKGLGGNDTIVGSGGNDTLNSKDGVNGNDSLAG
jgi:Ca2+-binding RTX toxin-like protein